MELTKISRHRYEKLNCLETADEIGVVFLSIMKKSLSSQITRTNDIMSKTKT